MQENEINSEIVLYCDNFKVCGSTLPIWWFDYKLKHICTLCDIRFNSPSKSLRFKENIECPICYETCEGVSYPSCEHYVCLTCFKRAWFPPSSQHTRYKYADEVDWMRRPLLENQMEYTILIDDFDFNEENTYEGYLKKCPICRR